MFGGSLGPYSAQINLSNLLEQVCPSQCHQALTKSAQHSGPSSCPQKKLQPIPSFCMWMEQNDNCKRHWFKNKRREGTPPQKEPWNINWKGSFSLQIPSTLPDAFAINCMRAKRSWLTWVSSLSFILLLSILLSHPLQPVLCRTDLCMSMSIRTCNRAGHIFLDYTCSETKIGSVCEEAVRLQDWRISALLYREQLNNNTRAARVSLLFRMPTTFYHMKIPTTFFQKIPYFRGFQTGDEVWQWCSLGVKKTLWGLCRSVQNQQTFKMSETEPFLHGFSPVPVLPEMLNAHVACLWASAWDLLARSLSFHHNVHGEPRGCSFLISSGCGEEVFMLTAG